MPNLEKILEKARNQREKGKPELALNTFNQALFVAQKAHNHAGVIQALTDRAIAFGHLFEDTSDVTFAILARKDAEAMLEMVKMWGVSEKLHTAYYMLGHAALLFKDYVQAENYLFKALRYFKGSKAEKGSWRYHYAKALYLMGEKKRALLAFSQALNEIKKSSPAPDSFLVNVYLSGAYLAFAEVLHTDNPADSKKYFAMAEEIINADKRLVVRKKQLKSFIKMFGA